MSHEIEWHPEQVAQAAKKTDDAGESTAKTRLSNITSAGPFGEELHSLIDDINGLADQMSIASAGIARAITEVNQAFIRVEADNQYVATTALFSYRNDY